MTEDVEKKCERCGDTEKMSFRTRLCKLCQVSLTAQYADEAEMKESNLRSRFNGRCDHESDSELATRFNEDDYELLELDL